MGKKTVYEYICDRCGMKIAEDDKYHFQRFCYMHVFFWWMPNPVSNHRLTYLCNDCYKSFKEWYKSMPTKESR